MKLFLHNRMLLPFIACLPKRSHNSSVMSCCVHGIAHVWSWINGPIWTGTDGMWCFLRHLFQSLRFHLSTLETKHFQNDVFSCKRLCFHRRFRGVLVWMIEDATKLKYAFSKENALVWMGPEFSLWPFCGWIPGPTKTTRASFDW